jgi:hypothetical protein
MKILTHSIIAIRSCLALAFALAFSPQLQAQTAVPAEGTNTAKAKMAACCQEMKELKQKVAAEMKAQDLELNALVAKVNRASEDKKVEKITTALTVMLEQRTTMNACMLDMQEQMMTHMMKHMQMGKESMAQCPMMKRMNGMDDQAAEGHKEQHPETK